MVAEPVASVARICNRTTQKPVRSNCTRTCLRVDMVEQSLLKRGELRFHLGEELRVH